MNLISAPLLAQAGRAAAGAAPSMERARTVSDRAADALQYSIWAAVLYIAIGLVAVLVVVSVLGLVMSYIERKVAGHFQCRLGPMRVGPHGILQSLADGIKLLFKEGIEPGHGDKVIFIGAPIFSITATILLLAIVPVAPGIQVVDMNVGVVYIAAVSGIGVMGILMGGWSSDNKWSLLGAMRAGAQMISYEISLTIAILVVVMFSGTLRVSEIIESQQQGWWIWRGHGVAIVAFCLYLIASTAELNRTPFDLPEGESELTGGYHTEYSGLRFSFFFLAEFANLFVFSALATTFFLGGWLPFHIGDYEAFNRVMDILPPVISPLFWFGTKCTVLIFVLMWFRWTFPRLRMDQLMRLEWKVLLPFGFANLILAATVVLTGLYFFPTAT
ncbi:NADH-quinone oxidoreductase subunit H [Stieleria maiorica]|uniref:NADH-quinone oxidoreductase subunit H n=2 Tax=Stieleria maiorica TaxID=2795974 RepID=A0A5B9MNP7_9BACT|nr:NADH-quinone oxidoreductase subunit H [Stieleria maiorica]